MKWRDRLTYWIDEALDAPYWGLKQLNIARIVVLAAGLGLSLACAVLLVLGLIFAVTGNFGTLLSAARMTLPALLIAGGSMVTLPRIHRRMLYLAQSAESGAETLEPLLETLTGLPLGRLRAPLAQEAGRLAAALDVDEWEAHSDGLNRQTAGALTAAAQPGSPLGENAEWLAPLLDAVARCERTEMLKMVERMNKAVRRIAPDGRVGQAAERCIAGLYEVQRRRREADTLLRPAPRTDPTLLRPAAYAPTTPEDQLVRPTGGASDLARAAEPAGEERQDSRAASPNGVTSSRQP